MSQRAAVELRRRFERIAAAPSDAIVAESIDATEEKRPTVTVLIPVYNAEQYVSEALYSVFSQTWTDHEIVAVDDGSTDDSPRILADLANRFRQLRVIRQPNSGISAALNTGLSNARAEFIARMDADDVMMPDRLARQVDFLRNNPDLGFCGCQMNFIDSRGRVFGEYRPKPNDKNELVAMVEAGQPITYTHPTIMVRRSLIQAVGGYDRRFEPCEDIDLFTRLIAAGYAGVIIPELLFSYRVHGGSIISGIKSIKQAQMLDLVMRNLRADLEGSPPSTPESLSTFCSSLPMFRKIAYLTRLRSEAWQQQAIYDRAAQRRWQARARLLAAAFIEPHRLLGRVLRRFDIIFQTR